MSIKERLKRQEAEHGVFAGIGGQRLDGKTTLAGTLPGKTLLVQAAELETGSGSALALAQELGNDLQVLTVESYHDMLEVIQDKELLEFDNLYFDGLSGISELRYECEDIQNAMRKDRWKAFGILGDDLQRLLRDLKKLTMKHSVNVFFTIAYKPKFDADGDLVNLTPDVKGTMAMREVRGICPTVLAVRTQFDEEGNIGREILTQSDDVYPARMETFLDHNNPKKVEANLALVLDLIKGVK